ncbi:hypothetical protein [Chitinophaga lutea]|uniref:hypothetical protein n=1 Tax=Chitinophaga lutea TaxID=2488634 RepID=UPI000F4FF958|nr:hypothetical protein [Chitinophaga lutea]
MKNNLGDITMEMPARWDTTLQWTDYSCNAESDRIKYRFQQRSNPVVLESGFIFSNYPEDSVNQLTIMHSGAAAPGPGGWKTMAEVHVGNKYYCTLLDANTQFSLDTIIRAGQDSFSILAPVFTDTTAYYHREVRVATIMNGQLLEFEFKLLSKTPQPGMNRFTGEALGIIRSTRLKYQR